MSPLLSAVVGVIVALGGVSCQSHRLDRQSAEGSEAEEQASAPELEVRPEPPLNATQTLAFTRYRWAMLSDGKVDVFRTGDFELVATFPAPGASNLVPLLGGAFLAAGAERVQRLSVRSTRPKQFAGIAEFTGPSLLLPDPGHAEEFSLHVAGQSTLRHFDLGEAPGNVLPERASRELADFDHRAMVRLRDGGLAYTVPTGLVTVSRTGTRKRLELPQLGPGVWKLARAARLDRLWVVDATHAHRVALRGEARVVEQVLLPEGTVAFDGAGDKLAFLSVERSTGDSSRLRIDVRGRRADERWVVRFSDRTLPPAGQVAAQFRPEIALSTHRDLVASRAFGIQVFNFRRGVRVFAADTPVVNSVALAN